MKLEQTHKIVNGIFGMSFKEALEVTSFIQSKKLNNILELGFAHGVSSCYFASILDEMKTGHLTTIDLKIAQNRKPNIEKLLKKLGLQSYVTIYYEPVSYNWRLMKLIEKNKNPIFDFCYVDGAHNWYTDGFAFFLIDKILKPGGWILFDDINWTYSISPSLKNSVSVQNMPPDERDTAQIGKVFELLVKPHPNYHNFIKKRNWAYAQKKENSNHLVKIKNKFIKYFKNNEI